MSTNNNSLAIFFARIEPHLVGQVDPGDFKALVVKQTRQWCSHRGLPTPIEIFGDPAPRVGDGIDYSFTLLLGLVEPETLVVVPSLAHFAPTFEGVRTCLDAIARLDGRIASIEDHIEPLRSSEAVAVMKALAQMAKRVGPVPSPPKSPTNTDIRRYRGGKRPYGFKLVDGEQGLDLVPNPEEMKVIERAKALRATGQSFRKIAQALCEEGLARSNGEPLHAIQIARMVKRRPTS